MKKAQAETKLATHLHRKGKILGMPISGVFELTARCNFNCPMCYVHMTPEQLKASGRQELTAQQWLDFAKAAKDRGMVFALLTGGEPMVRKDFFEIYDGMRKMGLMISINSNGSMLKGEILERFLEAPPARFNISLYGGCNETYQTMCGLPVYDQVKENIRVLRQAGVDVSLNLSITPYNKDDLAQIYADAVDLDVNVKASSYMYPSVRVNGEQYGCGNRLSCADSARYSVAWDELRFPEEEFRLRAEALMQLKAPEQEGCPLEEGEGIRCRAGATTFWMTWDGKMLPCGMLTTPVAYPLEVGFDAAWDQIRAETAKIRTPAKCVNCDYKEICGACAAVYFTETGRFDVAPQYVCDRAAAIVEETRKVYEERKQK
ncbi:MAG: radical SAM protein [Oscillospiraceae bacterium]|nr:radical SAM protein [Oscillospiraceae bacterium]